MALALYRTYRPASFAEVVGQEHVTEPLSQAIRSGRINHAYLFSGPRGCGKTSSARIMARSLNCVQGPTPTPCGVCDSCVGLAPDGPGSLDVIEIDAASHGGVDDARELRERAHYAPISSRFKVYIVDEAHMVTTQGFNALLKLVEEPPDFLVFIFATTEPDKVLTTIRSRTHHYPFRLLPPAVMRGLLERICAAEKVTVEPAVYPLVVRAGGGSARDSLSILDQLFAGAGDDGVTYATTLGLLDVTDAALLDDVVDALGAQDGAAVFRSVDRVVDAGHDPRRFAGDLLERLRDLIVLDAVPDAAGTGLLDHPVDQLHRMTDQAARLGTATLSRLADIVNTGLTEMRGTTSPRLLLELICARMLLPAATTDSGALLQRLERLERRMDIRPDPAASDGPTGSSTGAGRAGPPAGARGRGSERSSPPAPAVRPGWSPAERPGPARSARPAGLRTGPRTVFRAGPGRRDRRLAARRSPPGPRLRCDLRSRNDPQHPRSDQGNRPGGPKRDPDGPPLRRITSRRSTPSRVGPRRITPRRITPRRVTPRRIAACRIAPRAGHPPYRAGGRPGSGTRQLPPRVPPHGRGAGRSMPRPCGRSGRSCSVSSGSVAGPPRRC